MLYDPSNPFQVKEAEMRLRQFIDNRKVFELTDASRRSLNQNAYLHTLIGIVAMEYGTSLDYAKEWYYKRLCNADVYVRERADKFLGKVSYVRSSKELSKEEMSASIDRFKTWARSEYINMPEPGDRELLDRANVEISRCKYMY